MGKDANTTKPVRVRMAPSPTGNLHVGTARAALFNYLFARQQGGQFILRLEDTDKARSKPEFEAAIIEGLQWLGLDWDEGPEVGGPYGPYRQSERTDYYKKSLIQLADQGNAYYCYCPPEKKEAGQRHVCTCPDIDAQVLEDKAHQGMVVRLRVKPREVVFDDMVRGRVAVHTDSFGGDFVIARGLEDPLFHLAVVVDDAAMKISHVIRGEDHLHNTAKHILIQEALGFERPVYAHLPLLLDEDRRKLSKRSNETSLLAYRDMGYLPAAMLNYLALLGWNPGNDEEILDREALLEKFSLERVQKAGAIFSIEKLNSINKHYIRQLNSEELLAAAEPFLQEAGAALPERPQLIAALELEKERVATLRELPEAVHFVLPDWQPAYAPQLLIWRKSDAAQTQKLLEMLIEHMTGIAESMFTPDALQEGLMAWIDREGLGRGDTLWPMRVALTGQEHSPGPFEVAALLGKKETVERLSLALTLLQNATIK